MTTLSGLLRFPNLIKLAKCVLALPVSNAGTEEVFSIVRKVITDYCTQLNLCSFLACKLNNDCGCFQGRSQDLRKGGQKWRMKRLKMLSGNHTH